MSLIDQDQLDDLRAMLGTRLATMVATLADQAATGSAAMRDAVAVGDLDALAHLAHRLKGGAGALGAAALADAAARLEALARAGDGAPLPAALDALDALVPPTLAALRGD